MIAKSLDSHSPAKPAFSHGMATNTPAIHLCRIVKISKNSFVTSS